MLSLRVAAALYSQFGPGKFPANWWQVFACVVTYIVLTLALNMYSWQVEGDAFLLTTPFKVRCTCNSDTRRLCRCRMAGSLGCRTHKAPQWCSHLIGGAYQGGGHASLAGGLQVAAPASRGSQGAKRPPPVRTTPNFPTTPVRYPGLVAPLALPCPTPRPAIAPTPGPACTNRTAVLHATFPLSCAPAPPIRSCLAMHLCPQGSSGLHVASRMERFTDSYTLLLSDRANPQMWVPVPVIADRPQGSGGAACHSGSGCWGEQAAADSEVHCVR